MRAEEVVEKVDGGRPAGVETDKQEEKDERKRQEVKWKEEEEEWGDVKTEEKTTSLWGCTNQPPLRRTRTQTSDQERSISMSLKIRIRTILTFFFPVETRITAVFYRPSQSYHTRPNVLKRHSHLPHDWNAALRLAVRHRQVFKDLAAAVSTRCRGSDVTLKGAAPCSSDFGGLDSESVSCVCVVWNEVSEVIGGRIWAVGLTWTCGLS